MTNSYYTKWLKINSPFLGKAKSIITKTFISLGILVSFSLQAQQTFPVVSGPVNVVAGTPQTVNINDATNTAGISSGFYDSFEVTADWAAGGGNPWSTEAELEIVIAAGSTIVDPPTSGGANDGNATTLIFSGDFAGIYDPDTDGALDVIFDQSFGGSDADWSNIQVTIFEAPTCITPSSLAVSNVTTSTADLTWNADPTATSGYDYVLITDGSTPDGTTTPTGSVGAGVTTANLTGLTAASVYDAYVRSDCGGDGFSEWSAVVSFETPCVTLTAPFSEDFNADPTSIPICWSQGAANSEDWQFDDAANIPISHIGNVGSFPTSSPSAGGFAWVDDSFPESQGTRLESPFIDVSGLTVPALSFYFISDNEGDAAGNVDFRVEVWDGAAWNEVFFSNQNSANADWEEVIVDLSSLTITGDIQLAFIVDENNGTGFDDDVAIDDVSVDEAPSCLKPTNLALVEAFSDEAEFSWNTIANATNGYIWEVYNTGDDPTTTTPVLTGTFGVGTSTGLVTGLTELTDYDFYLVSDCDTNGTSDIAGPVTFSTLAICPSPSNVLVSNVTEDTADMSWDESFNASAGYNWELYLDGEDPAVVTPFQDGNVAFGTTTLTLINLIDNTDYDFYITSDCDTDGTSLTEGPISFLTLPLPPVNDDICDAIPLTIGVVPAGDAYNNAGATAQTGEPESTNQDGAGQVCMNGGINGSVWFTFDAPDSGEVEISTDIAGAEVTDTEIIVYEAPTDCTDPTTMGTEIGCDNDGGVIINFNSVLNLTGLTSGDTYYIQVDVWSDFTTLGDFGISVIDTNPPCSVPENIVNDALTEATADFSWDDVSEASNGYNWFVFNQGVDITTATPVQNGSVASGVLNINITGLSPDTSYDFYVQSNCGPNATDVSSLGAAFPFQTDCAPFTTPFTEDFEAFDITDTFGEEFVREGCFEDLSPEFDYRWNISDGPTPSGNSGPSNGFSGSQYIFADSGQGFGVQTATLQTPTFDLTGLSEPTLSFYYHMFGPDVGSLAVDIDNGTTVDTDVFTLSGSQQSASTDPWISAFVDLSAYSGQNVKFIFRATRTTTFQGSDIALDNISVDEAPSCFSVSGFTANAAVNTALLTWDEIPSAVNGYLLEVFEAGQSTALLSQNFNQDDTSFQLTGLTEGVSYVAEITSDCGAEGTSQTVQISFTTVSSGDNCNAPIEITGLPYTTTDDTANYSDFYTGAPGNNCGTTSPYLNGNDVVYSFIPANDVVVLVSMDPTDTWSGIFVYESCGDIGTQCYNGVANSSTDVREFEVNLQGGQEYIFVISTFPAPQTTPYTFELTEILCGAVSGLQTTLVSDTEIDFSWDAIPNATNYEWTLFLSGDDPQTATPVDSGSTSNTSLSINNLSSATAYDFYITTDCNGDLSETTGPITVVTECTPEGVPTALEDFEDATFDYNNNDFMVCWSEGTGTLTNSMSVTIAGGSSWGSKDFNNQPANPNGTAANVNLFADGTSWLISQQIDLGNGSLDLVVEYDVLVTAWNNDNSTPVTDMGQHTVSLVVSADGGNTWSDSDILKVFDNSNIPSSQQTDFISLSGYSGIVKIGFYANRVASADLDFFIDNFRVREAPTCFDPTGLEVLSVTDSTVELNWQAGSNETNFDIEVVPSGATPTGTPTTNDVSPPFTVGGLSAETDYDFYVRADCGPGDESFWVGPESFRTAITPVTIVVNDSAVNNTYCYDNSEFKEWLFISSDFGNPNVTPVEVEFNSGTIEDGSGSTDRFRVFDGFDVNATVIYDSDVDGTDLDDVELIANSGAMYMLLESDIFGSCQSGVQTEDPLDFDVFAGSLSSTAFSKENFNYYPNPVNSILNLESSQPIQFIEVFDIMGKKVFNRNFDKQDISVNFSNLSSGIYLMKVSIDNVSQTFKFVKK